MVWDVKKNLIMLYPCFLVDAASCVSSSDDEGDTLALSGGHDECGTDGTHVQADVEATSSDEPRRRQGAASLLVSCGDNGLFQQGVPLCCDFLWSSDFV